MLLYISNRKCWINKTMAEVSFVLPMLGCEAAGKGSVASLLLILCERLIWTADDPACIGYADNQRWLQCITLLSWGVVPCDCGCAFSWASSALGTMWKRMTEPPGWLCLEVSGFHRGGPEQCCSAQCPCSEGFALDGANLGICTPERAEIFHDV